MINFIRIFFKKQETQVSLEDINHLKRKGLYISQDTYNQYVHLSESKHNQKPYKLGILKILNYLIQFLLLIGILLFLSESGLRRTQWKYQAWQIITSAEGQKYNRFRIDVLQDLVNADIPLHEITVQGADLYDINLRGAYLIGANFSKSNLSSADLSDSDLNQTNFSQAILNNANFKRAFLWNANLEGVSLINADLRETYFWDTNLKGANLSHANLQNSYPVNADLRQAKLLNTDLRGANLFKAKIDSDALENALLCKTIMPDGKQSNRDC